MLFVASLIALVSAVAVPQTLAAVERFKGLGAARYLAARMALARSQAVARSATVALRFEEERDGVSISVFADGNRNGLRTRDIESGIDRRIDGPIAMSHMFPGVAIGLAPHGPGAEALQPGRSTLFSFTPMGTATSGTVYVMGKDGTQWGVRVLGATARTRVLRYDPATREWAEAF